jgi:hypothetical protein
MGGKGFSMKYHAISLLNVLQTSLQYVENPHDDVLWHKFYIYLEDLERREARQRVWERLVPGLKMYDPVAWKLALDTLFHNTVLRRIVDLKMKALLTKNEQQMITDDISLAAVARITEFSGESVKELFDWLQHIVDEYFELYSTSAKTDLAIKQAQTFEAVCHLVFGSLNENKKITLHLLRKFVPYERFLLRRWRKGKGEALIEPTRYPILASVLLELKKDIEAT